MNPAYNLPPFSRILIDSQHEELIGRINKLLDSCEADEGKISAIKMLDYLAKYTDTHFGDEEALQKEVCYPDYDKHHAKHEEFKQTIQELNEMLQEVHYLLIIFTGFSKI